MVGLLLIAWALRLPPLLDRPLHPDEALYGYWGLLVSRGRDIWLTSGPVYKPPLLPYLVSICQLLLGDTTIALRIPGLAAGLVTVPLVGALAHVLYEDRWTALSASVAAALSPFAVALSGTAFPDPLMVVFGVGACLAAARQRERWAGLLAALSFATKQTGLIWLPLVVGVTAAQDAKPVRRLGRLGFFYLIPLSLVLAWDQVRVGTGADSFWSAGVVGYGGLRLIWPHELWPRLRGWADLVQSLFRSPLINVMLLLGLPLLIARAVRRCSERRHAFLDLLLTIFCLVYVLLHWLVAFPIWSRYLLPMVPILSILVGRMTRAAVSLVWNRMKLRPRLGLSAGLLALLLILPAREASAGRSTVADDYTSYRGVEEIVTFLSELPEGSVVYHHWLGWHYHYALFDVPVYLAYWPTPAWLAEDVQAFGEGDARYVAFPPWESSARVEGALAEVGYRLEPARRAPSVGNRHAFVVYRIVPSSTR